MKHLQFQSFKINEINFRLNEEAYAAGAQVQNFKINPKIRMDIKQSPTNLLLTTTVTIDKHQDTVTPFELTLIINTSFQITSFTDLNKLRLEATDFTFPYVRATISQIMTTANLPAYYLPIIDFSAAAAGGSMQQQFGTPFASPTGNAGAAPNAQGNNITITPLEEI